MHRSAVHVMTASNIIDLDRDLTHLSTDTIILGHFDVIMLDPLLALSRKLREVRLGGGVLGYCGI